MQKLSANTRVQHQLFVVFALFLLSGCGDSGQNPLLLIGLDGATFDVIDPLIQRGKLPNLAGLMDRGARARLQSRKPMWSPCLWTTIATGKSRRKHGIVDFELQLNPSSPPVIANSNFRRTAALWNMVTSMERTTTFVGWWATYPAEKVNGFISSDHVPHTRFQEWMSVPQREEFLETYPRNLASEIGPLIARPQDISRDELLTLADFEEEELAELCNAEKPTLYHGFSVLRYAFQSEKTNHNIASYLLANKPQPDLTGLFLGGIDPTSHCFWQFREPDRLQEGEVSPADAERLGGVIDNYYEHVDQLLGELLEKVAPETNILIVSDHGFRSSGRLTVPERSQSGIHEENGILIAAGPAIKKSASIHDPSVLDITPTVLALLSLPVGDDMDGRVLKELMTPSFLSSNPIQLIESYDVTFHKERRETLSAGESRYRELLKELGYLGENRPDGSE